MQRYRGLAFKVGSCLLPNQTTPGTLRAKRPSRSAPWGLRLSRASRRNMGKAQKLCQELQTDRSYVSHIKTLTWMSLTEGHRCYVWVVMQRDFPTIAYIYSLYSVFGLKYSSSWHWKVLKSLRFDFLKPADILLVEQHAQRCCHRAQSSSVTMYIYSKN